VPHHGASPYKSLYKQRGQHENLRQQNPQRGIQSQHAELFGRFAQEKRLDDSSAIISRRQK
jgi:hypothetical protein